MKEMENARCGLQHTTRGRQVFIAQPGSSCGRSSDLLERESGAQHRLVVQVDFS